VSTELGFDSYAEGAKPCASAPWRLAAADITAAYDAHMPSPEPKVALQVLMQSQDAIRVTPFKEGSALESTVKSSRICPFHSGLVADRSREVLALLARANAGETELLPQLVAAGRSIWVDLLPAFLKQRLEEAAVRNLVLHLDRQLLGIPWELLHDGEEFLGRRFRIGRLVSLEGEASRPLQRILRAPLSMLIVADAGGDLPAARREASELADALDGVSPFGRVTVLSGDVNLRTFRDEFGRADVLHWAGHAHAGRGAHDGLALHDGVFTAAMADQVRGRVDFPGLVFLNGCGSHDGTARLAGGAEVDGLSGLAGALLLGGTRHVVGTLWDVRDEVARHFALAAYRELQRSGTIGGALAAAREALVARWGEDSLLWASHVLYGDPTWRPEQPVNAELEDFSVLDGLEQKYRRDLLSTDAEQRLMAAAMLLRLGDHSAVPALGRDLEHLLGWLSPDATQLQRRRAALVVQSLATAAGLSPGGPPDELPDEEAVRALYERLAERPEHSA